MTANRADSGSELLLTVLSALLREDVVGLRSRTAPRTGPDGLWLRLPAGDDAWLLPVRRAAPAFQYGTEARLPLLRRESDGRELTTADTVLAALGDLADPADRPGFDAFAAECREARTALRLHRATRHEIAAHLADRYGADPADWTGPDAALAFDTLAARLDHPVYPTSRSRPGLTEAALRACAPEFHPRLRLRWLLLPEDAVTAHAWDPVPLPGQPEPDRERFALPVHPLTAGEPLRQALRATGLDRRAELVAHPGPEAVPTLSMRTVALTADPRTHLKLPLATATLGRLNRRTIRPGTLTDGMAGQRLIEQVIAREPRFRETVLHTDETRFAHAGHELLAVLVRRLPAGLEHTAVVPLAALLAPAPGGRPLIDHLADRFHGGDPLALFDAFLTLLFDWQTTLFGYGIALESHQQNISLLLDRPDGRTRLRLLLKDNDGPRVNTARLTEALGTSASADAFDDVRTRQEGDGPVLDLFTTVTLHLCAGAYAFGLARHGHAPLDRLLTLVHDRLAEAAGRLDPRRAALLHTHVLGAPRLPIKAMVTAGTLLAKERSGASDINKHYTTGPNYLAQGRASR
ncbi:IucA/IucC family protein [Streptomyces jumonjinensis]|uniref:IucA/IucC family siderophore biosynthesis protein n=1 Tax=Streptomyces jumonjinensis TaxID=1945 RepID=A0A646KU32_STRJU|nr:IucA/IucC family protein [Streptomyces jumonjinensis]MQT05590.1 IucA/IucC family siderophore biosynthesis protein [Streptomyces jumonjinensis]